MTSTLLKSPYLKAISLMGLAVVAWTSASVASVIIPGHFSPYQIVWERYGWHLLILLALVWPRQRTALWRSQHPWLQLLRASTMVVMPLLFIVATPRIGAEDFWAFFWIAPLAAVSLAPCFLGEPLSLEKTLIMFVACLGMLLMFQPDLAGSKVGILASVGAGLCLSLFLLLSRLLQSDSAVTGLLYTALCVFVPMSVAQPWVWQRPTARELVGVFGLAICWFFVLYLFDKALELAPVTVLAPYLFLEPILAFSLAYLIFNIKPDMTAMIGACCILIPVAIAFVRDTRLTRMADLKRSMV